MLCPFRGDTIPYSILERKSNCGLRVVVSGSCPDKTNGQIAEWLRRSTFTFAKSRGTGSRPDPILRKNREERCSYL